MIKIKKIIFLIFLTLIFSIKVQANIEDGLFMTIGNKAITKSDVVNEIKIILILNNQTYSEEKRDELQKVAVSSIIKRSVKKIEIERNDFLKYSEQDFRKELVKLANRIQVSVETLRNICASNDLDFKLIEDQVKTELYWNSLIFQIYKNRLSINVEEIDDKLKLIQNKKINEYLISEILLKPIDDEIFSLEIDKIKDQIKNEGFEEVAKKLSISTSKENGGDLGWLSEDLISNQVKNAVAKTEVGKISEPIIIAEGILFFKVRDKRIKKINLTLEEMKNKLVNDEKGKILNIHSLAHYDKIRRSVSIKFLK